MDGVLKPIDIRSVCTLFENARKNATNIVNSLKALEDECEGLGSNNTLAHNIATVGLRGIF